MAYRLLALDMDGTLLDSNKRVLPHTREALRDLAARNIPIAYCTGRCFLELRDYLDELAFIRYGVLSSGGIVYDFHERKRLALYTLDTDSVLAAMDLAVSQDAMAHIMTASASVIRPNDLARIPQLGMGVYQTMFERICTFADDLASWASAHEGEVLKVNFYHRTPQERDVTRQKLSAAGLPLTLANAEATSVECSPLGVSKAEGLKVLANHLGIPISEVVAIGDSDNDAEALSVVGMPVAMGNASDAIRDLALLLVADNDHDGIAEAIDQLF